MTIKLLKQYLLFLRTFRNGGAMVRALRGGPPVDVAILRDGTRITHPAGLNGMVTVLLDLWIERGFMPPGFYDGRPGDVIVDCGAHIGLFSIWMGRAYPRCRIVALEPFAENRAHLEANLKAACPASYTIHRMALGRERGRGRIVAATGPGARSIDHTFDAHAEGDDAVPTVPLADLFDVAGAERIAFLKIDIEGSERDAFETATPETLARCERIALEYHDNLRPGTLDLIKTRLESTHDYEVFPSAGCACGVLLARLR